MKFKTIKELLENPERDVESIICVPKIYFEQIINDAKNKFHKLSNIYLRH